MPWGCYVDPSDNDPDPPAGDDREKPEVVASGVNITAIGVNEDGTPAPNAYELDGTSFAAPQVTGMAALLINRHSTLLHVPSALKAIVMASAIHNIEGSSRLSEYDGAGGIAATVGDTIAITRGTNDAIPCSVPCWWYETIYPSSFTNNNLNRYFNAVQGDTVRVVISWFSNAYCPNENNCTLDHLDTDLDLWIYNPSGTFVISSASFDNNYEIVEFVANTTGQYRIEVKIMLSTKTITL
ncbi:MAG: hypothetical protein Fur0022_20280 [Anaerolineales bacterium]